MSLFLDLSKIIAAGCRIGSKCSFGPISVSQGHWCSAIASHMVKMRSGKPLFRPFRFPLKRQKLGLPGSGRNDEMPVPKMDVAIAPKVSWCVLMPIGQQQIIMASQQEVARPSKLQKKGKNRIVGAFTDSFGPLAVTDVLHRRCQTNANLPQPCDDGLGLRRTKLAPLGESGAVVFEISSAAEMAFSVKMVLNRGVTTDDLTQTSRLSGTNHCPVSSLKRQVRFHRPVVQPVAGFLSFGNAGDLHRRAVDHNLSVTMMTGWPYRFIDFFVNFNAAFPSRRLVTQRSRTSPF